MKKARMTIDILMVVLLPPLMAYSLIGENIHEVLGICMFALFIAHHVINRKWWSGIFCCESLSCGFYDIAACQRDIDVQVCSERSDDQRSIERPANYSYDSCILGLHHDELSSGTSYQGDKREDEEPYE